MQEGIGIFPSEYDLCDKLRVMLENDSTRVDLYTLQSTDKNVENYVCMIKLNPDHPVYQGHFPDFPVTPGVCMMQMLRECVSSVLGTPLRYQHVNTCKFLAVVNPHQESNLELSFSVTGTYNLQATLLSGGEAVLKLKATLTPEQ